MATVLLVEPDAEAQGVLRDALAVVGHAVHVHATGRAGLDDACKRRVNLIVLGALLPDMTITHFCTALRRDPVAGRTRILLLADPWVDRALGLDPGVVDGVLIKPFSLLALVECVERLLSRQG